MRWRVRRATPGHLPPPRRDQGRDDRGPGGGDGLRARSRRARVARRTGGEVQPAAAHRGGAGLRGHVSGSVGLPQLTRGWGGGLRAGRAGCAVGLGAGFAPGAPWGWARASRRARHGVGRGFCARRPGVCSLRRHGGGQVHKPPGPTRARAGSTRRAGICPASAKTRRCPLPPRPRAARGVSPRRSAGTGSGGSRCWLSWGCSSTST